jgi:hypothetical protein
MTRRSLFSLILTPFLRPILRLFGRRSSSPHGVDRNPLTAQFYEFPLGRFSDFTFGGRLYGFRSLNWKDVLPPDCPTHGDQICPTPRSRSG